VSRSSSSLRDPEKKGGAGHLGAPEERKEKKHLSRIAEPPARRKGGRKGGQPIEQKKEETRVE